MRACLSAIGSQRDKLVQLLLPRLGLPDWFWRQERLLLLELRLAAMMAEYFCKTELLERVLAF